MTAGALQRARLVPEDGSAELPFHYNPSSMTLATGAQWRSVPSRNAADAATPEWVGADPITLTMDVLFDGVDDPGRNVGDAVRTLVAWTRSTDDSRRRNTPQASMLVLHWGDQTYGPLYLKTVSVRHTVFDPGGKPLRATATITLSEVAPEPEGTNPTSGGAPGRRSAILGAGDSLPALAYREYGDPNMWRAIAEANGVDDPARIANGTTMLVPPLAEAQRLAGAGRA